MSSSIATSRIRSPVWSMQLAVCQATSYLFDCARLTPHAGRRDARWPHAALPPGPGKPHYSAFGRLGQTFFGLPGAPWKGAHAPSARRAAAFALRLRLPENPGRRPAPTEAGRRAGDVAAGSGRLTGRECGPPLQAAEGRWPAPVPCSVLAPSPVDWQAPCARSLEPPVVNRCEPQQPGPDSGGQEGLTPGMGWCTMARTGAAYVQWLFGWQDAEA